MGVLCVSVSLSPSLTAAAAVDAVMVMICKILDSGQMWHCAIESLSLKRFKSDASVIKRDRFFSSFFCYWEFI